LAGAALSSIAGIVDVVVGLEPGQSVALGPLAGRWVVLVVVGFVGGERWAVLGLELGPVAGILRIGARHVVVEWVVGVGVEWVVGSRIGLLAALGPGRSSGLPGPVVLQQLELELGQVVLQQVLVGKRVPVVGEPGPGRLVEWVVGLGPVVGCSFRIGARHVGVELGGVVGELGAVAGWWVVGILHIVGLVAAIVAGE
jgi:hypothetical protein